MSNKTLQITRRTILKNAGFATAALGAVSLSACQKESSSGAVTQWDYESDIVVVGGGVGGGTAALTARENGDSVVLVEKAPYFGGTSAKTVGVLWIPNNFTLREKGIEDSREDCLKYLARYSFPEQFNAASPNLGLSDHAYGLLQAFYDNAYKATDQLKATGAMNLAEWRMFHLDRPATDYLDQVAENKTPTGRTLGTVGANGKMGTGVDMMGQLEAALRARDTSILLNHRAVKLIINDAGRVVGLQADQSGKRVLLRARKAVIFGSGGYAHNTEALASHQPNRFYGSCAAPMATGDFLSIAGAVGARMGNLSSAWRSQLVLEQALKSSKLAGGVFMPAGDSMFHVNKYGLRAVNEKRNYNDRTEVHGIYDSSRAEYPNQLMFMIYDQRSAEAFAGIYPLPEKPGDSKFVLTGNTLAELSEKISARLLAIAPDTGGFALAPAFADNLADTFSKFNRYASSGEDLDFQRGAASYDSEWHQAFSPMRTDTDWPVNDLPTDTMYPLRDEGPYYATILAAGALDTNGGPVIDANARVLNVDGQAIAGLYGAGNCIASPSRDAYWGAGCPLGLSLTFGHIAANAAHLEQDESG
ncbi:MAG: FAD-dependent oxidoreductase [Halioglobus sp.]